MNRTFMVIQLLEFVMHYVTMVIHFNEIIYYAYVNHWIYSMNWVHFRLFIWFLNWTRIEWYTPDVNSCSIVLFSSQLHLSVFWSQWRPYYYWLNLTFTCEDASMKIPIILMFQQTLTKRKPKARQNPTKRNCTKIKLNPNNIIYLCASSRLSVWIFLIASNGSSPNWLPDISSSFNECVIELKKKKKMKKIMNNKNTTSIW